MVYQLDFEQLKTLEAQIRAAPDVVRAELLRTMQEADLLLEREVKDATPHAHGLLRDSIRGQESINGLQVQGFVGSSLNYVEPVELGTRPHFPPVDALVDWVKLRFAVKSDNQARGIAFVIARKIAARGTEGAHMFENTLERLTPQLDQMFELCQERIAARLASGGASA